MLIASPPPVCKHYEFDCEGNGRQCIHADHVCNKQFDCDNHEDENLDRCGSEDSGKEMWQELRCCTYI